MMMYDLVIIGGGLGGSALAKAMAEQGAKVLILEAEAQFRDRVRGEWLAPWGVVEAKKLGIYELMRAAGGYELRYWSTQGALQTARDLQATTKSGESSLAFYHPAMQEALLQAAIKAGVEVRRQEVAHLLCEPGRVAVAVQSKRGATLLQARLIVAADGRNSRTRSQAGFAIQRDPEQLLMAGVRFAEMPVPDHAVHTWRGAWRDPASALNLLLFPQGGGDVRAYLGYPVGAEYRLNGSRAVAHLIELALQTGAPAEYFATARAQGPLATYQGADVWVSHPYDKGVALIGDAAATSDPTHGQGMSLTLRDARVLRDALVDSQNWEEAGHAYANAHDRYYGVTHTYLSWVKQLFFTVSPEAEARRAHVLSLWKADPTRGLDLGQNGPDQVLDEEIRRRFFGEDEGPAING
jgi:menaquinone-9 beta-reductase